MKSSIETLLKKTIDSFSEEEEVNKIYSFGSLNSDEIDEYSDIDISIVTNDINKTTSNLLKTLERISEVTTIFTLFEAKDSCAYTIFFNNYKLFQKLDIGISTSSSFSIFENSRLHYENNNGKAKNGEVFSQDESALDHQVLDIFIGTLRYIKYVNRNQVWIAYKFYKSFIETYLKSLLKLNPSDSLDINRYKELSQKTKGKIDDLIFINDIQSMSKAYLKHLRIYLKTFKNKISNNNKQLVKDILELLNKQIK